MEQMKPVLRPVVWILLWFLLLSIFVQDSSGDHYLANPDHVLLKKLHEVAGVYVNETKRKGLEKTVVITSCNHGFLNHLHNFKCFADRLGIRFLVMSMDLTLHAHLVRGTTMYSYLLRAGAVGNVSSESNEWASRNYTQITAKKSEAVYSVLAHGYDLFFAEVDIAIVRDPFPYLLYPGIQYVHSANSPCQR
jgi:hypothetical protein